MLGVVQGRLVNRRMRALGGAAGGLARLGLAVWMLIGVTVLRSDAASGEATQVTSEPRSGESNRESAVIPASVNAYSVAMHLHGHSNHNSWVWKGQVASMQWHSAQAFITGASKVLWWSDHARMFDQSQPFVVDVVRTGSGVEVRPDLDVVGLTGSPTLRGRAVRLEASRDGGSPTVRLLPEKLAIELVSDPAAEWQTFAYEPKSGSPSGLIHNQIFARPLSSGAILDLDLACDSAGPDAACEVEVRLAWHHEERPLQHVLRYRIDSEIDSRVVSATSPGEVLIRIPRHGLDRYSLDLRADAGPLEHGDDNTINRIKMGVVARRGARASMQLRGFRLSSTRGAMHQQLESVQSFARRYAEIYDQAQHVGVEFGDPLHHVNGFFPVPLEPTDSDLLVEHGAARMAVSEWVQKVHALGGVVSWNHPFLFRDHHCGSTGSDALCVEELARRLLENGAWEADLLEVGYLDRGLELTGHLDLWDTLTANELYLYGTGVTDSHGGEWEAQKNCMTTWILAPSTAPPDLLSGVTSGQMFFGNPLLWDGVFGFRVGAAFMGERLPNPGSTLPVAFTLEPWPEDYRVFLVQGLIQPGLEVEYLHRRTRLSRGEAFTQIDASRPSFVRLEVWSMADGDEPVPIVFTNPVVLHP